MFLVVLMPLLESMRRAAYRSWSPFSGSTMLLASRDAVEGGLDRRESYARAEHGDLVARALVDAQLERRARQDERAQVGGDVEPAVAFVGWLSLDLHVDRNDAHLVIARVVGPPDRAL